MSARVEDVSASAAGRGLPFPPRTAPERVPPAPPVVGRLGSSKCPTARLLQAAGRRRWRAAARRRHLFPALDLLSQSPPEYFPLALPPLLAAWAQAILPDCPFDGLPDGGDGRGCAGVVGGRCGG